MSAPPHTARALVKRLDRTMAANIEAEEMIRSLRADLDLLWSTTRKRLGIDLPYGCDPFLLDVLAMVRNEGKGYGAVWHWTGNLSNKGTPIIHETRDGKTSDRGTVRYLALAFGLIAPGDRGLLVRPTTRPPDDVNPYSRYLRGEALWTRLL